MSDGREPRAVSRSPSPDVEKRARLEVVDLGGRTDVDSESGAILDVEVDRVATVVATDPGAAIDGVDGVMSVPTRTSDSDDDEEEDDELSESDEEPYADDHPLAHPFNAIEAQELMRRAREIGYMPFVQEQMSAETPVLKLFHAFDFGLPHAAFDLPLADQWGIFAAQLQRFCQNRFKLPHINTIDDAVELLSKARKVLVLTGAGISVSCGIPDFRSGRGLYAIIAEKYPELMFDIDFFRHDPRPFFTLAKEIYPTNFHPSPTHRFLRTLQDRGQLLRNYAQNIDTLEKAAGIGPVIHCHGSFDTATCQRCKTTVDGDVIRVEVLDDRIPMCKKCLPGESSPKIADYTPPFLMGGADGDSEGGTPPLVEPIMKPDIVFFGEKLPDVFDHQIEIDRHECDLMVVIGSSLKVSPVAELVGHIPHKVPLILINREPVYHLHHSFDVQLLGYCDDIVQDLCKRLGWELAKVDGAPDAVTAATATPTSSTDPTAILNTNITTTATTTLVDGHTTSTTFAEHQHIVPNIYLYNGAVFDAEKHQRLIDGNDSASESSSDEEDAGSGDGDETSDDDGDELADLLRDADEELVLPPAEYFQQD